MTIHPSLVILVVLLCIGYVLQNIVIHNIRKTIDKQFVLSEKQVELSQMMIDEMARIAKLKGCKS